jgi:hypothetical protein
VSASTLSFCNGNNATLVNSPTFSSSLNSGIFNFNGSNNHATLPTNFFNHNAGTPFTVSFWFKTSVAQGLILGQQNNTVIDGASGWVPAIYVDTNGKIRTSCFWGGSVANQSVSAQSVNDNIWHNITVTFAGTSHKSYLDGQLFATLTKTQTTYASVYYYFIGSGTRSGWTNIGTNTYFTGQIATMMFYTRELSSQEVLQNFNAQRSRYGL